MLVHDYLLKSAELYPGKDVVIHSAGKTGVRSTYSEVLSSSIAIGDWLLSINLQPGFRAAILTDEPSEYVSCYFGILLAGGTVVGLNTQTSGRTLKKILSDCSVSVVFAHSKFIRYFKEISSSTPSVKLAVISGSNSGAADDLSFDCVGYHDIMDSYGKRDVKSFPKISPTDIAQIIYTSGTTGEPKGVMLRHSNLVANTNSIVRYLKLTNDDRVMAVLPFFYSYGNSVLLTHIAAGGSLVVNQNFIYPNVILDDMVEEEITGFSGVPSTYAILLHRSAIHKYRFPHLRYITQAGGAMSPKLAGKLQNILSGVDIYIMYGQTEASARLSYLAPEKIHSKAGSIGKAIPGVTLELLDPEGKPVAVGEIGEIVAKGDNIMQGYWGKPEETARVLKEGKLWTGDLARMDAEGYLFIEGRKSDMIKSGSHRIGPKEIEETILEHEAIHEAAVIGVEDEILGEAIKACVVLKPGASCTSKELIRHCRKLLPAYKTPHHVEFYNDLPKTTTGKISKKDLF